MGIFAIYAFYLFLFFWVINKKTDFIYLIPIFGLGMDMSFNYFGGFSLPAYIRGIIFLLFFINARKYITANPLFMPFYLFFWWITFLLVQSGEFLYSFKAIIQVIFSMLVFIVAYNFFNSGEKIKRLLHSLFWVLVIALLATSAGYLFGIGQSFDYLSKYDEEEDIIGLLGSSGLYSPGVVICLLPLIYQSDPPKYQKILLPFISVVLFIFMILTIRRTVILIPIVGMLGLLIFNRKKAKIITILLSVAVLMIISYPLYDQVLTKRFEKREKSGRFEEDFYKTEQRYVENLEMIEKIAKFDEPAKVLFGIGNNIFAENITEGAIARRMYHTDPAKLFYGVGLVGILIYSMIYFYLFNKIRKIPNSKVYSDYKAAAFAIFLILVFVSINGSINIITYRSIAFLLLGAILGHIRYLRYSEKLEYYKSNQDLLNKA